jgi:hypothetical protein
LLRTPDLQVVKLADALLRLSFVVPLWSPPVRQLGGRGLECGAGDPIPALLSRRVSNHATSHAGFDREIDRMILEVHVITGAALSSEIAQPFTS